MSFIKKLRPFDYLVILIILIMFVAGILTFSGKRATSSNQIEATTDIDIEIYLRGVTSTSEEPVFKAGDEKPNDIIFPNDYTKLKIKEVKFNKRQVILPSINPNKPYILVNDETSPYQYDYLIKVTDSAKITKDGDAVVGGNKVKIGIPMTLEGAKYKLNGVIANIIPNPTPETTKHDEEELEDLDKHTKLNQDVH